MTTVEKLEKFMLSEVAAEHGRESLKPDEDLLEQGIIDSLGIMKLIVFLEETFGIKVNDEDVVPENFQSLDIMIKFIEQKMRNK